MARFALPTQARIALPSGVVMTELHGSSPGPTLAVLGGVHGDEDEGVLAVHQVLRRLAGCDLTGTVRAAAPANPTAWAAQSRTNPLDGENLARCFPGSSEEGPTSAVAADITEHVIDGSDLLIDLHSAGLRYQMPLFCGFSTGGDTGHASRRAAEAFGVPMIWAHSQTAPGRSLSVAAERGIPAIYAECSGGGSIRSHELDAYVDGVLSVMADLGMLPEEFQSVGDTEPQWVYGSGDLDHGSQALHHGFFVSSTRAGALVDEDQEIGRFYDYRGQLLHHIGAPRQGVVMFLRRQARTQLDDVLFVLAQLKDPQE